MVFLNHFLNSFFSSIGIVIGAFLPILLLMYCHYLIRRKKYKKIIPYIKNQIDDYNNEMTEYEELLNKIYRQLNVKNILEIILDTNKFKGNPELYHHINNIEDIIFKNKLNKLDKESEKRHYENYNFIVYLSDIMEKKYPDKYITKKYKNL